MEPGIRDLIQTIAAAVSAIAAVVGAIAAGYGMWFAKFQLSGLKTSLLLNSLSAMLHIESEINTRSDRMNETSLLISAELAKTKPNSETVERLRKQESALIEKYINAVERLAFCIKNEYVAENDWRPEYRSFLANVVSDFPQFFKADSVYTNIIDLNNKWKRD